MSKKSRYPKKTDPFRRGQTVTSIFFMLPSFVLCAVFVIWPLINVVSYSFTDWDGIRSVKNFVGLQNYIQMPEIPGFKDMMIATFSFAIGVTVATTIISFIVALALDTKGKFRINRGLVRSLWFVPALLSGAIVGVLWRIMYNYNNGMINKILVAMGGEKVNWLETVGVTNVAIIVAATWVQIGLCIIVFMAGLQSIPEDVQEAALIDGATGMQRIRFLVLPLMAPSITINVITTTIAAFKLYELPYLISQGLPGYSTLLLTQRIYFYGFEARNYGLGSAISVMLLVIITLISLIQLIVLRKREDIYE